MGRFRMDSDVQKKTDCRALSFSGPTGIIPLPIMD